MQLEILDFVERDYHQMSETIISKPVPLTSLARNINRTWEMQTAEANCQSVYHGQLSFCIVLPSVLTVHYFYQKH
jgi:hypothetical protein